MSDALRWLTKTVNSGVILETETLLVLVLADQGATIYKLVYKPSDIDVLWKSRSIPLTASYTHQQDSFTNWCEQWAGGWSTIFPNGGTACHYGGVEMGFHGEVGLLAWSAEEYVRPGWVGARFITEGRRSPFKLEKTVSLALDEPRLEVTETIQNIGAQTFETVWGHHPTFGFPFIDEGCQVLIPAATVTRDSDEGTFTRVAPGQYSWPLAKTLSGETLDLSTLPPREARSADLLYLSDFERGEYQVYNPRLNLRATVQWPLEIFPYLWFWQEFRGTQGFPWYGHTYCVGLEPFSTPDAHGLAEAIRGGTALVFQPGEVKQATFLVTFSS